MPAEILNKEKILDHAKRLIGEGRLERAIQEYKKLVQADPKDARVKLRIAELYAKLKHVQDAIKVYQEVADLYVDDGFYLKAVTVYKNMLRLNPSLMEINRRLGELYEKMGLAKDAIDQYRIVASTYEQKGAYGEALDVRKRMVALDPHEASGRIRLAEAYQCQGMEEESLNEYEQLIELIEREGREDQLIELYEKVLSHRSDNLEMLKKLCRIYNKRGESKKAIKWIEDSASLVAEDPEMLEMGADIYARLNQVETAKSEYKELAELYNKRGDVDNALLALERLLILAPDEEGDVKGLVGKMRGGAFPEIKARAEEARWKLAEQERQREELEEARKETAEKISGGEGRVVTQEALRPEEVAAETQKALASYELGKAYRKMGLAQEAEDELKKALQIYRRLFVSNPNISGLMEKIRELEGLISKGEDTMDLEDGIERPEEKRVEKKAEVKKVETRPKVSSEVERPKEKVKEKKKRISFV